MKKLLSTIFLLASLSFLSYTSALAETDTKPEIKKTCVESKDSKTGKVKSVCKDVKIHKKLEGTTVPVKK